MGRGMGRVGDEDGRQSCRLPGALDQGDFSTCTSYALTSMIQKWLMYKYNRQIDFEGGRAQITSGCGVETAYDDGADIETLIKSINRRCKKGELLFECAQKGEKYPIRIDFDGTAQDFAALYNGVTAYGAGGPGAAAVVSIHYKCDYHAVLATGAYAYCSADTPLTVTCLNSWGANKPCVDVSEAGGSAAGRNAYKYQSHVCIRDVKIIECTKLRTTVPKYVTQPAAVRDPRADLKERWRWREQICELILKSEREREQQQFADSRNAELVKRYAELEKRYAELKKRNAELEDWNVELEDWNDELEERNAELEERQRSRYYHSKITAEDAESRCVPAVPPRRYTECPRVARQG